MAPLDPLVPGSQRHHRNLGPSVARTISYNDSNHLHAATTAGSWTYTHDANGNQKTRVTGGNTDDLIWDESNRLVHYDQAGAGGISEFVYDADGNRIVRIADTSDSSLDTYYVGSGVEVTDPHDTSPDTVTHYSFGTVTVGFRTDDASTSKRFYLATDHLGTSAAQYDQTNPTGTITHQYHLPYGGLRGATTNNLATDHTYTGQIDDSGLGTGLMFYNARYYDPLLKRFISADAIVPNAASSQDLNRFSYAANNPARFSDPTGHDNLEHDAVVLAATVQLKIERYSGQPNVALVGNVDGVKPYHHGTGPSGGLGVPDIIAIHWENGVEARFEVWEVKAIGQRGSLQQDLAKYMGPNTTPGPPLTTPQVIPGPKGPIFYFSPAPGEVLYLTSKDWHRKNLQILQKYGFSTSEISDAFSNAGFGVPTVVQQAIEREDVSVWEWLGGIALIAGGTIILGANAVQNGVTGGIGFADDAVIVPLGTKLIEQGYKIAA